MKNIKIVTKRDSATAILRKLGIAKEHYGDFIAKEHGEFYVDVGGAKESLANGTERMVERRAEKKEELKEELKVEVKEELKEELKAEIKQELKATVKKVKGKKSILEHAVPGKSKITVAGEKRTVSSVARELIMGGKTNSEVWELLVAEFGLKDDKKHYPAWYRSELKRTGKLK